MVNTQRLIDFSNVIAKILVLCAIIFICHAVYQQMQFFEWRTAYILPLIIAASSFVLTNILGAGIWHLLLRGLGEQYRVTTTARIFLVSQIAKYVPGNIAHVVGRIAMSKASRFSTVSVSYAILFELVLLLLTSALFATVTLTYADVTGLTDHIPTLTQLFTVGLVSIAIIIATIFLSPKLSSRLGQQSLLNIPRMPTLHIFMGCILLYFFTYVLVGLSTHYLANVIFSIDSDNVLLTSGIFTIALVAGFLAPGAPAGIGVREFVLVFLLTPIYGELAAVGIAALTRLAQLLGDSLTLLIGYLIPKQPINNKNTR